MHIRANPEIVKELEQAVETNHYPSKTYIIEEALKTFLSKHREGIGEPPAEALKTDYNEKKGMCSPLDLCAHSQPHAQKTTATMLNNTGKLQPAKPKTIVLDYNKFLTDMVREGAPMDFIKYSWNNYSAPLFLAWLRQHGVEPRTEPTDVEIERFIQQRQGH